MVPNGSKGMQWIQMDSIDPNCRDAKTYQRAKNVDVKNPILGKIFAKLYPVLSRK